MAKTQTARDRFRAKTIGGNSTRIEDTITLTFADGSEAEVLLRTPSTQIYEAAQEAAGAETIFAPDGKTTVTRFKYSMRLPILLMIHCCFEPTSGQAMFTPMDLAALLDEDANRGWLADLCKKLMEFIQRKPEAAAKNSAATALAATSSS